MRRSTGSGERRRRRERPRARAAATAAAAAAATAAATATAAAAAARPPLKRDRAPRAARDRRLGRVGCGSPWRRRADVAQPRAAVRGRRARRPSTRARALSSASRRSAAASQHPRELRAVAAPRVAGDRLELGSVTRRAVAAARAPRSLPHAASCSRTPRARRRRPRRVGLRLRRRLGARRASSPSRLFATLAARSAAAAWTVDRARRLAAASAARLRARARTAARDRERQAVRRRVSSTADATHASKAGRKVKSHGPLHLAPYPYYGQVDMARES